jgi:hypothetical protein
MNVNLILTKHRINIEKKKAIINDGPSFSDKIIT